MSNKEIPQNNKREKNIKNYSNIFFDEQKNKTKFSEAIHQYNNRQGINSYSAKFGRWIRDDILKRPPKFSQYSNNIKKILTNHHSKFEKFKELGGLEILQGIVNNLVKLNIIKKSNNENNDKIIEKSNKESNDNSTIYKIVYKIVGTDIIFDKISFFKLLIFNDDYIKKYLEIFDKLNKATSSIRNNRGFDPIYLFEFILKNSLINNNDENPVKSGMNTFLNKFYGLYVDMNIDDKELIKLLEPLKDKNGNSKFFAIGNMIGELTKFNEVLNQLKRR